MKLTRSIIVLASLSLFLAGALAQDPNIKHYDKDGLSFDYPAKWQLSDQSTSQMQFLELTSGDLVLRVRSPREWLKTPEKEATAKKIFQDQYVDEFAKQFEQQGTGLKRSPVNTTIAGAAADGTRLRMMMDRVSGGLDSYYLILSDRLVNLSILGSDSDITRAAPVWDLIRNSLKVEPPPQPKPSPSPSPKKP